MSARRSQSEGCLGFILSKLGIEIGGEKAGQNLLPYRLRDDFLSPAEASFVQVLESQVPDGYRVMAKVGLKDLFYVPKGTGSWQTHWNRINRKHVDFLVCEQDTMAPVMAIELDDVSHKRRRRQERDEFVDRIFQAAGLPLRRIGVKNGYRAEEIHSLLFGTVGTNSRNEYKNPTAHDEVDEVAPPCPKCGGKMLLRTATRGKYKGRKFYGCENYPKCRAIMRA